MICSIHSGSVIPSTCRLRATYLTHSCSVGRTHSAKSLWIVQYLLITCTNALGWKSNFNLYRTCTLLSSVVMLSGIEYSVISTNRLITWLYMSLRPLNKIETILRRRIYFAWIKPIICDLLIDRREYFWDTWASFTGSYSPSSCFCCSINTARNLLSLQVLIFVINIGVSRFSMPTKQHFKASASSTWTWSEERERSVCTVRIASLLLALKYL